MFHNDVAAMIDPEQEARQLAASWSSQPRWAYVSRPYTAEDVIRLRGSLNIEYTLARRGAERLWRAVHSRDYVPALGALTGNQAVQMVQAGLEAIYCSGWQVAADANVAGQTYPDLSLYPVSSVPSLVRRINNALQRADQIHACEGKPAAGIDWYVPIVADAEAGFGGNLNAFELMKQMIEAGAAGVHFEDQLSSAKKCGHMGGKVLVPVREFIEKLVAARLASDVMGVPTIIIARTDADSATLLTSDVDERDHRFITGERTHEGFFRINGGLACAIARGIAYAPYADMIWCETSHPDLEEARLFAEGIHQVYPGKLLAYNCSPSFNWKAQLDDVTISKFQRELGAMGYRFQFITLAGFHALNLSMFELSRAYRQEGMTGYVGLQQREFELERDDGYSAVKHQRFVGTRYFDEVASVVSGGMTCTAALTGSTEEEQFIEPDGSANEPQPVAEGTRPAADSRTTVILNGTHTTSERDKEIQPERPEQLLTGSRSR
ncbi:MAG TPA: isocitrate lyase [Phycisphaerae bacterium]|nr:isocitrate lyase [Phycisphaerae bacterium]HOJ76152.1 isocitrate lyase [Phycisphaerae bacterium]HOM53457.1 isocitrate lyase [Phycisphaerae bacterium]HON68075.1 isocitrate lyase [Phycisphaerae bacterium]HOQ84528.1 isocitrate lyase [Phycisphaerae bacterium]